MAIRDDYTAGEPVTAAAKNEENTALILLSKAPILVYSSPDDSTQLNNPTAGTPYTLFDTHTYNIPANDLIKGVGYSFKGNVNWTYGSFVSCGVIVRLGTTVLTSVSVNPGNAGNMPFWGRVMAAEAAAGASKNVRCELAGVYGGGSGPNKSASGYAEVAVATNGILTLQFAWYFDNSNAGNTAKLNMVDIFRHTKNGW